MIPSKRFIRNISASTLQLATNQVTGLVIFYVLSKKMDKASFGNFNWALAVLTVCFGMLQCGMDLLAVKKIASGENKLSVLPLYLLHVCVSGIFSYFLLLVSYLLFPSGEGHFMLLLLAIGRLFAFISTPFKQLCTGLEKFRLLLFMSVGAGVSRILLLLVLYAMDRFSVRNILAVFVTGDFVELVVTIALARRYLKAPLWPRFDPAAYKRLFKEALPLLGTAVLAVVIARLDWILIGIFLPSERLGEYSFAYKVFELSTFPLLIIAPLLVPRFSKIFQDKLITEATVNRLKALLSVELVIASLISMILIIVWVPLIDFVTEGKYGQVNKNTILILSPCISFLYFNNFFWTIQISLSGQKEIFWIFTVTFAVNLIADILLIPLFHNEGAAAGYLLSLAVQAVLFVKATKINGLNKPSGSLLAYPLLALASGLFSAYFFISPVAILISAVCIYLTGVVLYVAIAAPHLKVLKDLKKN